MYFSSFVTRLGKLKFGERDLVGQGETVILQYSFGNKKEPEATVLPCAGTSKEVGSMITEKGVKTHDALCSTPMFAPRLAQD